MSSIAGLPLSTKVQPINFNYTVISTKQTSVTWVHLVQTRLTDTDRHFYIRPAINGARRVSGREWEVVETAGSSSSGTAKPGLKPHLGKKQQMRNEEVEIMCLLWCKINIREFLLKTWGEISIIGLFPQNQLHLPRCPSCKLRINMERKCPLGQYGAGLRKCNKQTDA